MDKAQEEELGFKDGNILVEIYKLLKQIEINTRKA